MHKTYKSNWQMFVVVLCVLLAVRPSLGQQAARVGLRIVVVQGAGTNNVIQQIPPTSLVVRIENANGRPVPGAMVVFTAPEEGPSGEFTNDSTVFGMVTGTDGLAAAVGYHPNAITGSYRIEIRAEFRGESATTAIEQTNIGPGGSGGKVIAILAIVGAAVGAAVATAVRSGGSSSDGGPPDPEIVISFGGGAVGAPTQ